VFYLQTKFIINHVIPELVAGADTPVEPSFCSKFTSNGLDNATLLAPPTVLGPTTPDCCDGGLFAEL
jgi:hypothetical protein